MPKFAIVGAGFAGLSVCWHLLQAYEAGDCEVTLFDPQGVGGGASSISTGLLHPFPGRLALRSWLAQEGMEASEQLLQVAENELQRPVALRNGVLRIALEPAQKKAFAKRAIEDAGAIWVANVQDLVPLAIDAPGLWIPSGITVFSKLYLKGLWSACARKGAVLDCTKIDRLAQLDAYDGVILCAGSEILHFPECGHFPLEPLKGQTLLCRWDMDLANNLTQSLIGLGHITPTEDPELCQIGSTYERGFSDAAPTPEAVRELLDKVGSFYPPALEFEVMSQAAGVRMNVRNGYRPIVEQIAPKAWVFTGLGSRGLLYHAELGKRLSLTLRDLCK